MRKQRELEEQLELLSQTVEKLEKDRQTAAAAKMERYTVVRAQSIFTCLSVAILFANLLLKDVCMLCLCILRLSRFSYVRWLQAGTAISIYKRINGYSRSDTNTLQGRSPTSSHNAKVRIIREKIDDKEIYKEIRVRQTLYMLYIL